MKRYIYIIYALCLIGSNTQAQVLWSDDFDNYTLGNLGVINNYANPNPISSQGNWQLSEVPHQNLPGPLHQVTIEAETGRGKVLKIQDIPTPSSAPSIYAMNLYALKEIPDLDTLWSNRTAGNDILKYEGEFYVAFEKRFPTNLGLSIELGRIESNETIDPNIVTPVEFFYSEATKVLTVDAYTQIPIVETIPISPWSWIKVIAYVDYTTGYVYFEIPSTNIAYKSKAPLRSNYFKIFNLLLLTFTSDVTSNNGNRPPCFAKLDNFKVSVVNTLPLSLEKLTAATFTIFPNPVTDIVTITNSNNIGVEGIEVFDINGKKVKSQKFNKENQVQLNLADCATGTYLLYIKTNMGTAVEKVIKK